MSIAYVGLGSNLNDPARQIHHGIDAIHTLPKTQVLRQSSLHSSPPLGIIQQPDYINAVVQLSTALSASHLLEALLALESDLGRIRDGQERWGPRVIDMDLLLYDESQLNLPFLTLPHPGIKDRSFVFIPLLEISPDLILPDGTLLKKWAEDHPDPRLIRLQKDQYVV